MGDPLRSYNVRGRTLLINGQVSKFVPRRKRRGNRDASPKRNKEKKGTEEKIPFLLLPREGENERRNIHKGGRGMPQSLCLDLADRYNSAGGREWVVYKHL